MQKQSVSEIKKEIKRNDRIKNFRRIATPKKEFDNFVMRPFSRAFRDGKFVNDIYFSMNPTFIVWVYVANMLRHFVPAFLLHGLMFAIHLLSINVMGDDYAPPTVAFQLLVVVYITCFLFGLRKANDHMAYYNLKMLLSKYKINQLYLTALYRSQDVDNDKELAVMDEYRRKFNKYSLFPSAREIALEEQLYESAKGSRKSVDRSYAETRRKRLNMSRKEDEHKAAKEIAEWKQAHYGGINEYDALVAKYKNRTVPAIHTIIESTK